MKESRYVIGINKEGGIWFYVGTKDHEGVGLSPVHRYSSIVDDAMVYDNYEEAERIANSEIPREYVRWVMAVYDCPKCERKEKVKMDSIGGSKDTSVKIADATIQGQKMDIQMK